jgi:predicted TIM-barrel fold metal-dependent hydrolase
MTVIDIHGHVSAPPEFYTYKSLLHASRGTHGKDGIRLPDELVSAAAQKHVNTLKQVGTDIQLISPRPFQQMHSEKPEKVVRLWIRANNDIIAQSCRLFPDVFRGVAGIPQNYGVHPANTFEELERCIRELGFVGCVLNPDPGEGAGEPTPNLGNEYWYPLYEKLVELDCPALIHAASCRCVEKESYSHHMITEHSIACWSLANSRVFEDFPELKIVISHGGGSVPYQIGRWRAGRLLRPPHVGLVHAQAQVESFDDSLRRMYFDGVLYSREALEYLIRTVGADRVMFGTEVPGVGSAVDPHTGRPFDDLKPLIDEMQWLPEEPRRAIFEGNALRVFTRLKIRNTAVAA